MTPPRTYPSLRFDTEGRHNAARALAHEVPVALTFSGTTLAVMMACPDDLEDFAIGFALSEGVVTQRGEIQDLEIVAQGPGFEARGWLSEKSERELRARQRAMIGPVGCGLCGIDTIDAALRPLPPVATMTRFSDRDVSEALDNLRAHQPLHDATRAVHAAGFLRPGEGVILAREDVGRHNALDKLIGALARAKIEPGGGAIVLTSRISIDMVQKAAFAGVGLIIAPSAPTAQALDMARAAGISIAAFARRGAFDVFCHPDRIEGGAEHVA